MDENHNLVLGASMQGITVLAIQDIILANDMPLPSGLISSTIEHVNVLLMQSNELGKCKQAHQVPIHHSSMHIVKQFV